MGPPRRTFLSSASWRHCAERASSHSAEAKGASPRGAPKACCGSSGSAGSAGSAAPPSRAWRRRASYSRTRAGSRMSFASWGG
eukprot:scaffold39537_cov51-Phaeocystis_antarctica.AAC.6